MWLRRLLDPRLLLYSSSLAPGFTTATGTDALAAAATDGSPSLSLSVVDGTVSILPVGPLPSSGNTNSAPDPLPQPTDSSAVTLTTVPGEVPTGGAGATTPLSTVTKSLPPAPETTVASSSSTASLSTSTSRSGAASASGSSSGSAAPSPSASPSRGSSASRTLPPAAAVAAAIFAAAVCAL
ncbi:uncharacterized protein LOC62_07G009414 [Vanrija pseudolonga]|uniref:Uncharacterized protein n=1 Tax=Vanrija pseudolonga TaxID=143232 RepID=A0AAF0YLU8_9TREE|nr:hypothetical protein LOC62_07G009414 [Vanrija pseudolonga]